MALEARIKVFIFDDKRGIFDDKRGCEMGKILRC